jgi:hypothetical protein
MTVIRPTEPAEDERISAKQRPVFLLRLRPEPGIDALSAIRVGLKGLLRRHGLRCVGLRREDGP